MKNIDRLFQETLFLLWKKEPEDDFVIATNIGKSSISSKNVFEFLGKCCHIMDPEFSSCYTTNHIGQQVLDQQQAISKMLITRASTMNNDMIRIDTSVSSALGLSPDLERIARAENFVEDGKIDARRD